MSALRQPRIRCAKCGTLIQNVYWSRDNLEERVFIRVKCHGEMDTMTINLMDLSPSQLKQVEQQVGVAFETKGLLT